MNLVCKVAVAVVFTQIVAGCAATGQRSAGQFENYDMISEAFECSAANGEFHLNVQVYEDGPIRVAGTVRMLELRGSDAWAPTVAILIGEQPNAMGAQIRFPTKGPRLVNVIAPGKADSAAGILDAALEPIPFQLVFDSRGAGMVQVGDVNWKIRLIEGASLRVTMGCSSGRFRFEGVSVTSSQ